MFTTCLCHLYITPPFLLSVNRGINISKQSLTVISKDVPGHSRFSRDIFLKNLKLYQAVSRPPWCNRMRYCATSWNVAGSIPDGLIGIFDWNNLSGTDQASNIMSTGSICRGCILSVRKAEKLFNFICRLSRNSGASTSWSFYRPVQG
jgi:hypothetical protein